jgi:hypothetical protein
MNVGKLVYFQNVDGDQIVCMCTEDDKYVVVHSDNLTPLGKYIEIDNTFKPFIGTVHMTSKESAQ